MIRLIRHLLALLLSLGMAPATAYAGNGEDEASFRRFLAEIVRPQATMAGVSDRTFNAVTSELSLDWSLPDLSPPGSGTGGRENAFQAEFRSPGRYLDPGNLSSLAKSGAVLAAKWRNELDRAERETGVPAEVILAIWGRESNYGKAKIALPAIRTLATQAFMGARREIFLAELVAAIRIVEEDHLPLDDLRSSWAGALGQPQFLPSKFLVHAVDGDGDGRRDIWTSAPDVLASIAGYLRDHGWRGGRHWGEEILLPAALSCALEGPEQGREVSEWEALGVTRADGGPLGAPGDIGYLMLPAGRKGPAFLVSENFYVLKRYNESDLYALFVGHLADRIAGSAKIAGSWSAMDGFTRGGVRDLQQRLIAAGHDVGGADGLVGFRTRIAIGREQERLGLAPTCFPDASLMR